MVEQGDANDVAVRLGGHGAGSCLCVLETRCGGDDFEDVALNGKVIAREILSQDGLVAVLFNRVESVLHGADELVIHVKVHLEAVGDTGVDFLFLIQKEIGFS